MPAVAMVVAMAVPAAGAEATPSEMSEVRAAQTVAAKVARTVVRTVVASRLGVGRTAVESRPRFGLETDSASERC